MRERQTGGVPALASLSHSRKLHLTRTFPSPSVVPVPVPLAVRPSLTRLLLAPLKGGWILTVAASSRTAFRQSMAVRVCAPPAGFSYTAEGQGRPGQDQQGCGGPVMSALHARAALGRARDAAFVSLMEASCHVTREPRTEIQFLVRMCANTHDFTQVGEYFPQDVTAR